MKKSKMRSHTNTFSGVTAVAGPFDVGFSGHGPANIARGEYVSGDYVSTVGAKTILGRPLSLADDAPTASPAIELNYEYWQRAFGADPSTVGRTVRLNNVDVTIVGVAEPGFTGLRPGKSRGAAIRFGTVSSLRRRRSLNRQKAF